MYHILSGFIVWKQIQVKWVQMLAPDGSLGDQGYNGYKYKRKKKKIFMSLIIQKTLFGRSHNVKTYYLSTL